jgi:hypothetical protein
MDLPAITGLLFFEIKAGHKVGRKSGDFSFGLNWGSHELPDGSWAMVPPLSTAYWIQGKNLFH